MKKIKTDFMRKNETTKTFNIESSYIAIIQP